MQALWTSFRRTDHRQESAAYVYSIDGIYSISTLLFLVCKVINHCCKDNELLDNSCVKNIAAKVRDRHVRPKKIKISYSIKDQLNRNELGKRKLMESRTNLVGKFIHKNILNISN